MGKVTNDLIGIQYAQSLYDWADSAVESGDYSIRPFATALDFERLAVGAVIDLEGKDCTKTTAIALSVMQNTLATALKNGEI